MLTGDPNLIELLREEIRRAGPIPFAVFMDQALYHPAHGYYSSGRAALGRGGDYFTNVSVGPLFGRLLAAQFSEMWEVLGRPNEFTLVEQGAHEGEFARDVLEAAQRHHAEFSAALRYTIVEPFDVLRHRQSAALAAFRDRVTWRSSLNELAPFSGVHFSNELLDSMPVHVVRWSGTEWRERHVDFQEDSFRFVDLPTSNRELIHHLARLPGTLPAGYETEVHLASFLWIEELAPKITRGFVLAVDYGFARENFYAPHRTAGTLQVYAKHAVLRSPFEQIGHADITAHVEWSTFMEHAEECGFEVAGLTDQHHFMSGLLASELGWEFQSPNEAKTKRALQTLLHPGFLGMKFQFLALSKEVDLVSPLSGFRFARSTPI